MKSISAIISDFLTEYYDYFEPSKDGVYRPKMNYFLSYLTNIVGLDDGRDSYKLETLEFFHIEKSMDYYIDESKKMPNPKDEVKKENTLWNYFTVIKIFFKYLHKIGMQTTV